jgi:hypothetical protein
VVHPLPNQCTDTYTHWWILTSFLVVLAPSKCQLVRVRGGHVQRRPVLGEEVRTTPGGAVWGGGKIDSHGLRGAVFEVVGAAAGGAVGGGGQPM